jgi:hypothetical protein
MGPPAVVVAVGTEQVVDRQDVNVAEKLVMSAM